MADINETVRLILSRRSVRKYTDEPLSKSELDVLLDCAMWAPSARNKQSCVVRALNDKAALDSLNQDFKDKIGWDTPAYTGWETNPVYQGAPCLFMIFSPEKNCTDAGIMVQNIAIAAESMGLNSCIIGSVGALFELDEGKKWKRLLGIDESWHFLISIAVGHSSEKPEAKQRNKSNFKIINKI